MARVEYVIYKRCVPGDRRKVEARSQDADSGGGARDLRFNPPKMFEGVVPEVFEETKPHRKGGQIIFAPVYWWENNEMQGPTTVEFGPPYKSRKDVRLSRVHKVIPFDEHHLPPAELDPFFFIWNDEERVWARYVTVADLRQPGWPSSLVGPILTSVKTKAPERNIRGWRNLSTGEGEHSDA